MPIVRFPLDAPTTKSVTFTHHEVEPGVVIDTLPQEHAPLGVVRGFYGKIAGLPADPSQPGERHSSEPFEVVLDAQAMSVILGEVARLAREQGVAGLSEGSAPPIVS